MLQQTFPKKTPINIESRAIAARRAVGARKDVREPFHTRSRVARLRRPGSIPKGGTHCAHHTAHRE